jgi:hypothetical protein
MDSEKQDGEIVRLLDVLGSDPALKHLRSILIENLLILEKRHRAYNGEQSVLENCYTDLDATALQNLQQAFVRIKGQCKANGSMLRDVPMNNLEGRELLQDNTNWGLIWQCCRREVKGYPAMDDIEQKRIEKQNELRALPEHKSDTNVNGCGGLPQLQD